MPKYRNVTNESLSVQTEHGWADVAPDEILTVSDEYAASHYLQTGETGEPRLWELVADAKPSKQDRTPPSDD